jgi:hypothetical protein
MAKYTPEQQARAWKLVDEGRTQQQVEKKLGLSHGLMSKWRRADGRPPGRKGRRAAAPVAQAEQEAAATPPGQETLVDTGELIESFRKEILRLRKIVRLLLGDDSV